MATENVEGQGSPVEPAAGGVVESAGHESTTGAEPRDFTDNDLVRVPGLKEPIKYGELYKRLQSDHTKKTTEAANLRRQLESEKATWAQSRQQEEARLKALATELLARQRGGQGTIDPFAKLEGIQFLDGKTAAQLFRDLQENGLGGIHNAIRERDSVIEAMAGQLRRLQAQFGQINGSLAGTGFESKIDGFLKNMGLSDKYKTLAKEIYLAYEGDDLDEQFPAIFQERLDGLRAAIREEENQRIEAARRRPFPLPGKGGTATAGKKLELTGRENARETADKLWDALQGAGNDT